ncbi:hypothetical protein [Amycolatopsis sp. NPDC059021]|uniref:hypothetical protein n=1 Tax=Amycolatopsis sp. NPDC059021 TaxID=3346704 RepID=UPI0036734B3D
MKEAFTALSPALRSAPANSPADAPGSTRPRTAAESAVRTPSFSIERGSEVALQLGTGQPDVLPRPLTEPEIDLLAALDPLVGTPRQAKRLFNLYRMLRATRDLSEASRFLGDDDQPGEYQAVIVLLGLLTAHPRLLGRALDTAPDPAGAIEGGLMHRAPEDSWELFVAGFEPRRSGRDWANQLVGPLTDDDARTWAWLHRGLITVSDAVTLPDLSCFQLWVPKIRRFSYVLSPDAPTSAFSL